MKISIITATYNSADVLSEALESIRMQTYRNIEHILVDGNSRDGTHDLLREYAESVDYSVRIISEDDKGVYDALNKGIRISSGDVIGFLHSDDFWKDPQLLEKVASSFDSEDIKGCYGNVIFVSRQDVHKVVRKWNGGKFSKSRLLLGWMPPHPSVFLKREVYGKYGLFDTNYSVSSDYELLIRFLYKHGINVKYVPSLNVYMRIGGRSTRNLQSFIRSFKEDYAILKRHNLPALPIALVKRLRKLGQFMIL